MVPTELCLQIGRKLSRLPSCSRRDTDCSVHTFTEDEAEERLTERWKDRKSNGEQKQRLGIKLKGLDSEKKQVEC